MANDTEKAKDEPKLGPNVTYNNPDGAETVTMGGVTFQKGKAVDLEKRLGKDEAKRVLKKLAGNTYFKVDGGPDHAALAKDREKAAEEAAKMEEEAAAKAAGEPPADVETPEQATLEKPNLPRNAPPKA